jgi:hypothetical protein
VQNLQAGAVARYFAAPPVSDTAAEEVVGLDYTGALWVSTNPTAAWVQAPSAGAPAPRSEPALAFDASTGQVVLFGGELAGSTSAAGEVMGDTWTWDGTSWTEQAGGAPASTPSATPVPTASGVPSLPSLPSASAVAGSAPPASTPTPSAAAIPGSASPASTSTPSVAAGPLRASNATTG